MTTPREQPPTDPAWVYLRSHHAGTLSVDGEVEKVRFVLDGGSGYVVLPAHPAVIEAGELVLFVPDEAPVDEPELQLLVLAEALGGDTEPADRWRAYHGDPLMPRWITCAIDSGKFDGAVVEGEVLQRPNALRVVEPRLCKRLNSDKAALTAMCQRRAGVAVAEPLAVGVDPTGIDVKARFGIVHVGFGAPVWEADAATAAVEAMLGGAA